MIRYHSNQIVNKGKKGKFTTKREVYHVVVNIFFCLLLVGIYLMTNHFCHIMKREMKKAEPEILVLRLQCGVVKIIKPYCIKLRLELSWSDLQYFCFSTSKMTDFFLYSKTIKTTQSIWRPYKLTTFEEYCMQAIHPSQRCVMKPICTAVGKENVYTFADNCLDKIKNRSHSWTWKTSAKNLSGTVT